jgi:hypothetical protein
MAKQSKVNISITGDSKGFGKAADDATKRMRQLRAETERTKKKLGEIKSSANQAAEGLAKFGAGNRGLQMLGGAAGLTALGPAGLGLAAGGLAFTAASAGIQTVLEAIRSLPDERKKAVEALKQVARDDRNTFAQFGLTPQIAKALAEGRKQPVAAGGMGFQRGFTLGMGSQNSAQMRLLSTLVNEVPGAMGIIAGARVGGAPMAEAQRIAAPSVFGETAGQQIGNVMQMKSDFVDMMNSVRNWIAF